MAEEKQKEDQKDKIKTNTENFKRAMAQHAQRFELDLLRDRRLLAGEKLLALSKLDKLTPVPPPTADQVAEASVSEFITSLAQPLITTQLINEKVSKIITLAKNQLVILAAQVGHGKSAVAANIAYSLWQQGKKVLLVTTEEKRSAFEHRLVRLKSGINSAKAAQGLLKLSDEEILTVAEILQEIPNFVRVIDKDWVPGKPEFLTTVDGFQFLWEQEVTAGKYDAIVIDYYQNVCGHSEASGSEHWQNQMRFGEFLEVQKGISGMAPIFLLAQVRPPAKNLADVHVKDRLWGAQSIAFRAGQMVELVVDWDRFLTTFFVWKSRDDNNSRSKVTCGYDIDRNAYVVDDWAFSLKQKVWIETRQRENVSEILEKD